ncbi:MAG: hypothetical protein Kow0077_19480 [Anaerolineae bacterium]
MNVSKNVNASICITGAISVSAYTPAMISMIVATRRVVRSHCGLFRLAGGAASGGADSGG